MAILQQSCLEYVRSELTAHFPTYQNYAYIAPQEAVYPFMTVSALSSTSSFTFSQNLEFIRIQISIFDNSSSATSTATMMDNITDLFHRAQVTIPSKGCSINLICTHKTNEFNDYMDKEHYYMGVVQFEFTAQKTLGCSP